MTSGWTAGAGGDVGGQGNPQIDNLAIHGPRPWVDVITKGADPYGVLDSGVAFNQARASLPSVGGIIMVPQGTYKLTTPFTFGNPDGVLVLIGLGVTFTGSALPTASGSNAYLDLRTMNILTSGGATVIESVGGEVNRDLVLLAKGSAYVRFGNAASTWGRFTGPAVAVNFLELTSELTAIHPGVVARGTDTNIGIDIFAQGSEVIVLGTLRSSGPTQWFTATGPAVPANYLQAGGASAGSPVTLTAIGPDTDIRIELISKGIGGVRVPALGVGANEGTPGRITTAQTGNDNQSGLILQNLSTGALAQLTLAMDRRSSGGNLRRWKQTIDIGDTPDIGLESVDEVGVVASAFTLRWRGGVIAGQRVLMTYSASMTPDSTMGNIFVVTATNGTAFTINAPPAVTPTPGIGQRIVFLIRNTSGGALGVATWNAIYKMTAWTQPANGFSRSIEFYFDGTNWVEYARGAADVPN